MEQSLVYRNTTIQELQDIKVAPDQLELAGMSRKELLALYTVELMNNDKYCRTILYNKTPLCMVMYNHENEGSIFTFTNSDIKSLVKQIPGIVKVIIQLLLKHNVNDCVVKFKESNKFTQKVYSYLDDLAIKNGYITYFQKKDGWIIYKLGRVVS